MQMACSKLGQMMRISIFLDESWAEQIIPSNYISKNIIRKISQPSAL